MVDEELAIGCLSRCRLQVVSDEAPVRLTIVPIGAEESDKDWVALGINGELILPLSQGHHRLVLLELSGNWELDLVLSHFWV